MRPALAKEERGRDISIDIERYFAERGTELEPMLFDINDENWSLEEQIMLRMYVHVNTDANGCYTAANGDCISPVPCQCSPIEFLQPVEDPLITAARAEAARMQEKYRRIPVGHTLLEDEER